MNPETSLSTELPSAFNPQYHLLPENVRANPHMFVGWREGLLWALCNNCLLLQFKCETGSGIDIGRGGIGSFIAPERGFILSELGAFVEWYNRTVWEPVK